MFSGFAKPMENWSKLPHAFIDALPEIETLAEMKVVLYVLRHTWGYGDFDKPKRITLDEFEHGRKGNDESRLDNGVGMYRQAIIDGIRRAIDHGFLTVYIDDSDGGRIKKYYALRMQSDDNDEPHQPENSEDHYPEVGKSYEPCMKITYRSKKDTYRKKEKEECMRITHHMENTSERRGEEETLSLFSEDIASQDEKPIESPESPYQGKKERFSLDGKEETDHSQREERGERDTEPISPDRKKTGSSHTESEGVAQDYLDAFLSQPTPATEIADYIGQLLGVPPPVWRYEEKWGTPSYEIWREAEQAGLSLDEVKAILFRLAEDNDGWLRQNATSPSGFYTRFHAALAREGSEGKRVVDVDRPRPPRVLVVEDH